MAVAIRMPDLGTTVEECRVLGWRVREGDTVALGDILADIETDKAIVELESVTSGTVLRLLAQADDVVAVGDVLAYVGAEGDSIPEVGAVPPLSSSGRNETPEERRLAGEGKPAGVSPVVRNLAARLGVDLATVQGTGQGGVITREDVRRAASAPITPVGEEPALSRGQAAVARAVASSWAQKPHLYVKMMVDMTAAQALRERSKAEGSPLSYDALLLAAMARALPDFPALRSVWRDNRVMPLAGLHLALAVSHNEELCLPVIRDVDQLTLPALQAEITELVAQVRAKALPASRLTGACLALSNLGMYPVESFDPIIFPEHSAILAVGAAQPTPVVLDGEVVARPIMRMTLAADHRVVNGRTAAAFLTAVKQRLESGDWE